MIQTLKNEKGHQLFFLNTCETTLALFVPEDGHVFIPHWGGRIEPADIGYVIGEITRASYLPDADGKKDFKLEQMPQIYPSFGYTDLREPAFSFRWKDGSRITDLRYFSYSIKKGKKKPEGLPAVLSDEDSETLEIVLRDELKQVEVVLIFGVFEKYNAITQSVLVRNCSQDAFHIEKICSASMDLLFSDMDLIQLSGAWGRECHIKRRHLEQGKQAVGSTRGASSHGQNPFAALVSPNTTEDHGEVYAMNFVYSGNFLAEAEVDMHGNSRFQMGIHPFEFEWRMNPGEEFQAPEVVLVYSGNGLGQMSRTFHRLYRDCLMPGRFGNMERPVLLNSWEASYFQFTRNSLVSLANQAAEAGAELFVLDDGWFGKRNDTMSSVGDWIPYEEKLGGTLESLINDIRKQGIAFGLWFEPEMVSPDSKLYRDHPEWVIQVKGRRIEKSRDEYVLDLANPAVCDYVICSVGKILEENPISYVKWDMNRNFTNTGSLFLPPEQQKELPHRYMLGLYHILDCLTERFENVLFEGCAGGGGRCDPGMLYYMPQIWISDDTDAMERLPIQYGTSLVYPSIGMGCHISDIPNHQTGRRVSIETRAAVAMWGNMGLELDFEKVGSKDRQQIKKEIDFYKKVRPIVQFGDLYRLNGLENGNEYAWMYISKDRKKILLTYIQVMSHPNTVSKRLRLKDVEKNVLYRECVSGRIYRGCELTEIGVAIGRINRDGESRRWLFEKISDDKGGQIQSK